MIYWISVNERLPKSGQEVLSYYLDTFCGEDNPIDQIDIVTYFKKGIVDDWKKTEIREDGFYLFDNAGSPTGECDYRKHADCITHWMPLPVPPYGEKPDDLVLKAFESSRELEESIKGMSVKQANYYMQMILRVEKLKKALIESTIKLNKAINVFEKFGLQSPHYYPYSKQIEDNNNLLTEVSENG